MSQGNEKWSERWQRFKARLQHTYRLVIMNNETFEEVSSYRLTLLNVYVLLSSVLVVMAVAVWLLIAFTPLRKYVPGYGDILQDDHVRELYEKMEEMEEEVEAQRNYADNFRRILVGEVETEKEVPQVNTSLMDAPPNPDAADPSEEEMQLRSELMLEEVGDLAKTPRTANLSPRGIPIEQMYFTTPVSGEISAGFTQDEGHNGVDILAPKNTAVKAALDGYVFLSDWTLETGNTIGIQHANDLITFYKHNSSLLKKVGSFVKAGEAVAIIGNTGTMSSGPHLHFEIWYKGKPIDPTEYVDF